MKLIIVIAAIVGIALAAPAADEQRDFHQDFSDFAKLLPVEDLTNLANEYYTSDRQVQQILKFLKSPGFVRLWNQFFGVQETKDVLAFFENAGVDVYDYVNKAADVFGTPHVEQSVRSLSVRKNGHGLAGLIRDAVALFPKEDLHALFEEKYNSNEEFKALVDKLEGEEFNKLADAFTQSKQVQTVFRQLRSHGIIVEKLLVLFSIFNFFYNIQTIDLLEASKD
uniref:Putative secreted protein n=1 Tax=Corethrella appendiculata TaxID=1370023 RepID=U5EVT0_9DIPT